MCERMPPAFLVPYQISARETVVVILIFAQKNWSTVEKYVEKGIVIEDVDRCSM